MTFMPYWMQLLRVPRIMFRNHEFLYSCLEFGFYLCGSDSGYLIRPISEHGVEFDQRDNTIQIKRIGNI